MITWNKSYLMRTSIKTTAVVISILFQWTSWMAKPVPVESNNNYWLCRNALMAERYSECEVASILKLSKTVVHNNEIKLHSTKLQTGWGKNRLFTGRNGPETHLNVTQQPKDDTRWPKKKWQKAAGVKCMVRMVWNSLLEAGLKSSSQKPFINEKQKRARLS